MDPAETYEHHGVTVEIHYDDSGDGHANPREGDNPAILYCCYPGYELGDYQLPRDGFEEIQCPACGDSNTLDDCDRCENLRYVVPTLHEWLVFNKAIAAAPLFVYEHSGITMRTGKTVLVGDEELTRADTASRDRFIGDSAGWDTSMVGFAIVTEESLTECCGDSPEYRTLDWLSECIANEVKYYAMYLEGQVYGYIVANDTPFEDSCWGFLGDDHVKEEANHAAECAAEQIAFETKERAEMAARDIVTEAA